MVPNALAALVLVPLLLGLTVLVQRIEPKTALPVIIHNLLWALTILLVGSDLIEYREASIGAWGILLVGLLFFNVGALVGGALARQRSQHLPLSGIDVSAPIGLITIRGLVVLLGLYGVGFAVYLYVIHIRFGLRTLITNPTLIRAAPESYLASVPLWARLLLYIGPLLVALLVLRGGIIGQLKLVTKVLLLAGLALSMVALLQRTNLFIGATWGVAALLMAPPRWPARTNAGLNGAQPTVRRRSLPAVAVLALVAVGSILAFQVVGSALGKSGDASDGSGQVSPILQATGTTPLFRYLTTGVPAFLLLTESTNQAWPPTDQGRVVYGDYNPQTWGSATFEPIASLIPGVKAWNPVNAFVDVGVLTNVYTWLEPFYRDFRVVGVGAGALGLGILITYLCATRTWSPRRFWLAALFLSTIFLSTFVPKINSTPYLFGIILVTLASAGSPSRYRPRVPVPDTAAR